MTRPNDGGPAFPCTDEGKREKGMTLRDWFAGQALLGIIIEGNKIKDYPVGTSLEAFNAHLAYKQADAMLKVR